MPPHKYEQAKERARDDLDRRELVNLVHDLPCVVETLVDGDDEPWRQTQITIGFTEDYGGGIDDTITVMQRAGWRVDGVTFGNYRRLAFVERDAGDDQVARPEPTRSEPADFGYGESTGVQDL
jgi:hypothetical protein